jgi:cation:H+ antiporter
LTLTIVAFAFGALVSLSTSWLLVTRLERIGERIGLSEALLGVMAALAADAPEITSSVSALAQHQRMIGSGVIIGSNVFNLAALLGIGAVVAGSIAFHRRVVVLGGVVAIWIALCCAATVSGVIPVLAGLALAFAMLLSYVVVLGVSRTFLLRIPLPSLLVSWLSSAVDEEELELEGAIRPMRGRPTDALVVGASLVVVVLASVTMERSAARLGQHFHVADAVIGGVVLAVVTSLPNAVAAVYLARRGRGAAALSTALSSNNLNVVAGLLIPGAVIGVAAPSFAGNLTAISYLALTVLALTLAFVYRRLDRRSGCLIVGGYLVFVVWLLAVA